MSNIVNMKQGGGVIPTDLAERLRAGIARSRATTVIAGGGKPFLRLLKSGDWVYGAENIDVEEGSQWQINPLSLTHGWSCWVETGPGQKNELRGEVMTSMADDKPARPDDVNVGGKTFPYVEQRGMDLKCIHGEDAGTEIHYKTTSVGGMRAFDAIIVAIETQLPVNPAYACPVIELGADYYDHTKYGRTYVPVFSIVGWADMLGGRLEETEALEGPMPHAVPDPEPAPAPRKRTRAAAAPAQAPEPAPSPAPTQNAHATQRRRPGR